MAHIIILNRLDAFRSKVEQAHDYLVANEQNQTETYAAVEQWLDGVEGDTNAGNTLCISTRTAEIDALLP